MKQSNIDLDTKHSFWGIINYRISNYLRGIGAYLAVVWGSFFIFTIIISLISDPTSLAITGLLSYLMVLLLMLVIFSAFTTSTINASTKSKIMQFFKRFMDVIITSTGFAFIMPLLLILSVAIAVESPGPIVFGLKQVGQFGKTFEMYKFRTKRLGPTKKPETKVGNFMLRFSLNELPALINVLNGEMSLVGPVPRTPKDIEKTLDPEGKILSVRPGITGLWQVSGLYPTEDSIRLDLEYVENWSLALDIKILFKTINVVASNG